MRKASSKSTRGPGTKTRGQGKTSISSTMTPVFGSSNTRQSAARLKRRPTTGR